MKRACKIVICALFFLLLLLPTIQSLTCIFPEPQTSSENRTMAVFPNIKDIGLENMPAKIEEFYNDKFPFRAVLLNQYFRYKLKQKQSPIPQVVVGDNMLFQQKSTQIYTGKIKMNYATICDIVYELKKRQTFLESKGIKMYVMIVPAAPDIYPEFLPKYIRRTEQTQTDLFCALMDSLAPNLPFINVKQTLVAKKKEHTLYRKGDNHWNSFGAYYASEAILTMISKHFPCLPPQQLSNYNFTPQTTLKGNLIDMLLNPETEKLLWIDTIYTVSYRDSSIKICKGEKRNYSVPQGFSYPDLYEQVFVNKKTDLPKIVIIRDSFFNDMNVFIIPFFRESVLIWDAWQYSRNYDIIEKEHPDIVLYEITENAINNIQLN